jgi:hypothetical protein
MSEEQLRKTVALGYRILTERLSSQKQYKYLLYRGQDCIAQFKQRKDAETAMSAMIGRDTKELIHEPVNDVCPSD